MNSAEYPSRAIIPLLIFACHCIHADELPKAFGTANHIVYLNMKGGMSQYETFDFHDDAYEGIADPPKSIPTSVEGLSICEWLPKTAALMDRCMLLRTVEGPPSHENNVEQNYQHTGYTPRVTVRYPYIGSWCALRSEGQLPYFRLNCDCEKGAAFLPEHIAKPIVISSPGDAIETARRAGEWNRESRLLEHLNGNESVTAKLFGDPEALTCLDWTGEPEETRAPYGDHDFGKACLIARRLVEKDKASFVEVVLDGWDQEGEEYLSTIQGLCGQLDDGFSALIADLERRDLLDETLVLVRTEFGRLPYFQDGKRRFFIHFSPALLAGGGIIPGQVLGKTTKKGLSSNGPPITAKQFNGIIGRALRLDIHETAYTPNKRPVTIGDSRDPLKQEVFR